MQARTTSPHPVGIRKSLILATRRDQSEAMSNATEARPLHEYRERLPQVRRHFALYADRMEVEAVWTLGRRQHTSVPLAELEAQPTRRLVRNRWFKKAILVASLAVGAAVVLQQPDYAPVVREAAAGAWVLAGVAAVVAAASYRRRTFVLFARRDGGNGLDLCNAGPDSGRFEAFVAETNKRIRQARK